jgi:hypothetical protein
MRRYWQVTPIRIWIALCIGMALSGRNSHHVVMLEQLGIPWVLQMTSGGSPQRTSMSWRWRSLLFTMIAESGRRYLNKAISTGATKSGAARQVTCTSSGKRRGITLATEQRNGEARHEKNLRKRRRAVARVVVPVACARRLCAVKIVQGDVHRPGFLLLTVFRTLMKTQGNSSDRCQFGLGKRCSVDISRLRVAPCP